MHLSISEIQGKWPKKGYANPQEFAELKKLARDNPHTLELHEGGFISDEQRAQLYLRCRLAICASKAEGFGHYILEAARFGCLVVTTNAFPMAGLLTDNVALAEPTSCTTRHYGPFHEVPSDRIIAAVERSLKPAIEEYSEAHIRACVSNFTRRCEQFQASCQQAYQLFQETCASVPTCVSIEDAEEGNPSQNVEKKLSQPHRFAYCVLLMSGDNYMPGCIVVGHSLRKTNPQADLVCLVTEDVSASARRALKVVFDHVIDVPYLQVSSVSNCVIYECIDHLFNNLSILLLTFHSTPANH